MKNSGCCGTKQHAVKRTVKVGLIGFGTIGASVAKVLISRKGLLHDRSGVEIVLARVCDKDVVSRRSVKIAKSMLTTSIAKVLYDPEIDIVVELVGGVSPAKEIVLEALRQGKHVVTANKALLSRHGQEIFALANTLGLSVGFEASVGGGIPIIRALKEGFVANRIDLVYGIVNGTCNFILTKMGEDGMGFKDALALAQKNGYAERDPSLDISGHDSAHKLAILSQLSFGVSPSTDAIYTEGIVAIEPIDIVCARESGYAIKLLAIAKRSGSEAELRVHPTLIPSSHLLASVGGVFNALFVKGDLVGENLFYGRGAGGSVTSSAVAGDIVSIAKSIRNGARVTDDLLFRKDVSGFRAMDDVRARNYLRLSVLDNPGVLAKISGILGKHGISIATVNQKASGGASAVPVIMMTHEARERDMARAIGEIDRLSSIKKKTVRVRIEGD